MTFHKSVYRRSTKDPSYALRNRLTLRGTRQEIRVFSISPEVHEHAMKVLRGREESDSRRSGLEIHELQDAFDVNGVTANFDVVGVYLGAEREARVKLAADYLGLPTEFPKNIDLIYREEDLILLKKEEEAKNNRSELLTQT